MIDPERAKDAILKRWLYMKADPTDTPRGPAMWRLAEEALVAIEPLVEELYDSAFNQGSLYGGED